MEIHNIYVCHSNDSKRSSGSHGEAARSFLNISRRSSSKDIAIDRGVPLDRSRRIDIDLGDVIFDT